MPKSQTSKSRIPGKSEPRAVSPNFITEIIERDLRTGRCEEVVTRFPPEPNGYLHIGHAQAITLDFGVADDYGGRTNLRLDDTNPTTENEEFVEAIKADVRWLGFEWDALLHASDYFERLYAYAQQLIRDGLAYVDSLSEAEIRAYRGTVTEPGRASPYRDRPAGESLELLERMRRGEFEEGAHVLRAKIDMSSPNMLMRDPLLYRIRHARHYRTGNEWHIYPMYDFAHPLSDAIEGVTHSLCTLEFDNNRELYDWLLENTVGKPRPHQYEFARLNLDYTVTSKRRLVELVKSGAVSGWDDPRLPTLAGLRRRGVTPEAIRSFANRAGVTKSNSRTSYSLLEHAIRDDLNERAPRVMAVTDPLPVTLTNYPEGAGETLDAPYWPDDVGKSGSRPLPFARRLVIEREDFAEEPPKGWRRLSPGAEVRLRHGYVIRCDEVVRNADGGVAELRCSYDPDTLGSNPEGRKVQGAIHWLAADAAVEAEFRLFDRLFSVPDPTSGEGEFLDKVNPESLTVRRGLLEKSVLEDPAGTRYQFERLGYFWPDPVDHRPEAPVFNRIVGLKDSFSRAGAAPREQAPAREAAEPRQRPQQPQPEPQRDPAAELTPEQKTRYLQYRDLLGLDPADAALIAADEDLAGWFEEAVRHHGNAEAIANWVVNELLRELKDRGLRELPLSPASLAELVALVDEEVISNRIAKEVFAEMLERGAAPREVVAERGLEQLSDADALAGIVERLVAEHPDKVSAYRGGKRGLAGFFVGEVMRRTEGRANPQLARELIEQRLS